MAHDPTPAPTLIPRHTTLLLSPALWYLL
jgi:hypothetical protein